MRYCVFVVLLLAQTLVVGCGQATYDERLKANIDNPKRMSGQSAPANQEEEPEEEESGEWTAEDLEAEEEDGGNE